MKFSDLNLLNQLRKTAFVETAIASKELADNLEKGARPVLGFYIMLGLSTTIATFGLLSNSVGIIIGAMIVAPLMNPIVALSFGISCGNLKISKSSLVTLVSGILFTVVMAYLGTKLIGFRIASEEIIGRTNPSLLDLGVAIAAGGAAAFAYSRKSIANALAGAAIAVALVPPLCVVGIGLAAGAEAVPDTNASTLASAVSTA